MAEDKKNNTWVELHMDILSENIQAMQTRLSAKCDPILVVKANAYGHGMIPVAKHAWRQGIKRFAVAHMEEACKLRKELSAAEILIMGVLSRNDVIDAINEDLIVFVVDAEHARELSASALECKKQLRCHVKVDTGMGRLGIYWEDAVKEIAQISGMPGLALEGIASHFAEADCDENERTLGQIRRFESVLRSCREKGIGTGLRHISNSDGILSKAEWDMDAVRPGLMAYGYGRKTGTNQRDIKVKPFLEWKTRIVQVRNVPEGFFVSYGSDYVTREPTKIGIIDIGYADGYSRLLGNKGVMLIKSKRRPVIGRVTMNLTVVDLGIDSDVQAGEEVTLIGRDGDEHIWADELAGYCSTIPYEILTNIRSGTRRVIL